MRVDIRSTSMTEMERLERNLRQSVDRAVEEESLANEKRGLNQFNAGRWAFPRRLLQSRIVRRGSSMRILTFCK